MEVVPQVPPSAYLGGGSQEPGRERDVGVVNGVELATCELEHDGEDTASTDPVRMPGFRMAAICSPRTHPGARAAELTSATPAESTAGTPCVHPDAWSGTESMSKETGHADSGEECCEDPLMLTQRTMRKGVRKQIGRRSSRKQIRVAAREAARRKGKMNLTF